jgi:dTDP-4-dehydrorhamnose 3,5-epimerase
MIIEDTSLKGVKLIKPTVYEDYRGTNVETWHKDNYEQLGVNFILDSVSTSRRHTLRGIHGDDCTTKLVSCLHGTIYQIVINLDEDSDQYGQWQEFTLSDRNGHQVLLPPKHGNAHLVMSEHCVFSYKLDQYYDRKSQYSVKWNDERFNIYWPIKNPILSERDR